MTLKYSSIKRYDHSYHDGKIHFSIVGGELYGQKLVAHRHRADHNRVVYLSKDYVLKIDVPFGSWPNEYLNQGEKEYKAYKKLTAKQRKFVPELVEVGQIYIPLFGGKWAWYVVTKRVYGKHPPYTCHIDEKLEKLFYNVTEDFHPMNVIVDKEGKQWMVDLGF